MIKFCKKCQCDTERQADGECKLCAKARRAANRESKSAYQAAYRAANRESIAAYQATYSAAYYAENRDSKAAYQAANRESIAAYQATYRAENRDSLAAYNAANSERRSAYNAAYAKANPEAMRIKQANRRALKKSAGGTLSKGLSQKLFELQRGKCACCGQDLGKGYHMDHIMPLALGGSNTDDNIQLLRATCNHQKHAKDPIDFMQQRGKLL